MSNAGVDSETTRSFVPQRVRTLIADGYRWLVSEVPAPLFDRRRGTHLIFDGEIVMRRVRVFPSNWFELSDQELYALTDHLR